MDQLRAFPDRLQDLINREKVLNGKTVDVLGKEIGCSKTSLSEWQNGKKYPNSEQLVKLARYFNVTADYLLGLTDTKMLNTDIRKVTDYTGLSEKAVVFLNAEKTHGINRSGVTEFLSYLATHSETAELVQAIKNRNNFITDRQGDKSPKLHINLGADAQYEMPMDSMMKAVVDDIFWKILKDYNVKTGESLIERRSGNGSNSKAD